MNQGRPPRFIGHRRQKYEWVIRFLSNTAEFMRKTPRGDPLKRGRQRQVSRSPPLKHTTDTKLRPGLKVNPSGFRCQADTLQG